MTNAYGSPGPEHEVVHECPPDRAATMPCCGQTPFEVPPYHRMTIDPQLVTCIQRWRIECPDCGWVDHFGTETSARYWASRHNERSRKWPHHMKVEDRITHVRCEAYVGNAVCAFPCSEPSGHDLPHVHRGNGQTRTAGVVGPLRDVAYAVTWEEPS